MHNMTNAQPFDFRDTAAFDFRDTAAFDFRDTAFCNGCAIDTPLPYALWP